MPNNIQEDLSLMERAGVLETLLTDRTTGRRILTRQVYGMAPTRIIYLIATNFILGFDESLKLETGNFVQADAAEASKAGRLADLVDRSFGEA